jgi:hypothetical protein
LPVAACDLEAARGEDADRGRADAAARAEHEHGAVARLDAVLLEPLHDRQRGGEAGGAERHRLARAQPVGQRHDPVARHARVLGEAAVVGDAEVVAVDDHLAAPRRRRDDLPARSTPGTSGEICATRPFGETASASL